MNHEHPGLSSAGTPDGADPLDRPRRRAGQPPRSFEDDFKAYPRVALDKSLKAHHIDLMMVQLGLTRIEGSERTVKTADSIDTELISCFTAIRRSNIGRYITELEEQKFLKTQRSGTRITNVAWGHRKGIQTGLKRRDKWVYMPRAVLLDPTLPSTAVQTYAVLRWLSHTLVSPAERNQQISRKRVFHPGTPLLIANTRISTRVTARKRLQELRDLKLIVDQPDVPTLCGIKAISFTPLEIRYAFLEDFHEYNARGLSRYVPVDAVNGPALTQAERYEHHINGRRVEVEIRKVEEVNFQSLESMSLSASRREVIA